jgi:hypothetical protein
VYLSFSINSARYCASLSAAVARSSAALRARRCAMMSAWHSQDRPEANHQCSSPIWNHKPMRLRTRNRVVFTMPQSSGCLRSPSALRHPPIDAFEQVAELRQ